MNTNLIKILLIIEFLLCFSWPIIMLFFSFISSFIAFGFALLDGEVEFLALLIIPIFGFAGLYGVLQVNLKLFNPSLTVEKPGIILICLGLGITAMLPTLLVLPSENFILYFFNVLPILATTHYIYLLRDYLLKEPLINLE